METKNCQNCKQNFVIEAEDFVFYDRIKVPPPTFCPECRTARRLSWRNEMILYKRPNNAPGHSEMLISLYPPSENLNTVDLKYWWSDEWDPFDFGSEYDFSKPFFQQWKDMYSKIPLQALSNSNAVNSDYCNIAEDSKDSYLVSASWKVERSLYSNRVMEIKDSSDLYVVHNSELCYEDIICSSSYNLLYSVLCKSCVDSCFLYDCVGCTNCFGCTNLRNKSYCLWNEQLSKEEYNRRMAELDLSSYSVVMECKEKFKKLALESIHRFANQIKTVDSTGDNLEGTKNVKASFDVDGEIEDCKFIHWSRVNMKDSYDSGPGVGVAEMLYEAFDTGIGNFRNLFTSVVYSCNEVEYSFNCHGASNLFGCIGLRGKNYCILNRPYEKEEYEKLLPKIKEHMMTMPYVDALGRTYGYGEFFPSELSPFSYNETVAQDYFPLGKEEALKRGYRWREKAKNEYMPTILAKDLPDKLADVSDSITKEIIGCLHGGICTDRCTSAYRITLDELSFYKRMNIPLPRLCFGCRHDERLRQRNPMKLWERSCMCELNGHDHEGKCPNEFETPYAPERPETIYCESCYQKEVM